MTDSEVTVLASMKATLDGTVRAADLLALMLSMRNAMSEEAFNQGKVSYASQKFYFEFDENPFNSEQKPVVRKKPPAKSGTGPIAIDTIDVQLKH